MKKAFSVLFLVTALLPAAVIASPALQSLTDEDLGNVAAQQGIAFNMEFRINSQADGSAVPSSECPDVAGLTGGKSCRLALYLADHDGMWIVMKNYRGIIKLNNIRIDASNLPAANSSRRDITSYLGGFDPNGKPAIQLTTGPWGVASAGGTNLTSATYYTYLNQSSYNDFSLSMDVSRMTLEFDCGAAVGGTIYASGCSSATAGWDGVDRVPGYLRDAITGSAISLRVAKGISSSNLAPVTPAQIRLDGRLQLYGY